MNKTETIKHSPTPWVVMGNYRNGHIDYVLPLSDNNEFQANARLISAAPELLAALKRIVYTTDHHCIENSGYCKTDCMWKNASVTIAKAEGR